jgi:hypothetical protein
MLAMRKPKGKKPKPEPEPFAILLRLEGRRLADALDR